MNRETVNMVRSPISVEGNIRLVPYYPAYDTAPVSYTHLGVYKRQEQGLAGDGGVAVQAGFLDHQSGSVTDVAQHLVGGGGDDQDHARLELCADLFDGAADAGLAGGVGQSGTLGADANAGSQTVADHVDLDHVGGAGDAHGLSLIHI